eukprot:gene8932-9020_t
MGWVIIAIGSIVSALGALVAYSGLDYVQIERGWTAVIAGTTLLSGGVIVISIGFMTLQIAKLAVSRPVLIADAPPVSEPSVPEAPLQVVAPADVAEPELASDIALDAPVEIKPVEIPVAATPEVKVSFEPFVKAGLPLAPARTPAAAPDLPKPAVMAEPPVTQSPLTAPKAPVIEPAPMATLTKEDLNSLDWLEEAISGVHEIQEPSILQKRPVISSFSSVLSEEEVKAQVPEKAIVPADVPKPAAIERPVTEKSAPAKVEPQYFEPSVVGRYEAAGTSYAMYSDGSVEAENEHGIFRFASMAELRAFIEEGADEQAPPSHQP